MSNESARFQPRRAIRLIFEYEGDNVRLVGSRPSRWSSPTPIQPRRELPATISTPATPRTHARPGSRTRCLRTQR